jgi:hypothetical protein
MELKRHQPARVQPRAVNDVARPQTPAPVGHAAVPDASPQPAQPVAKPQPSPAADDSLDAILVHEQANEANLGHTQEHKLDAEKHEPAHEDKKHEAHPKPEKIKANLPAKQHSGLGGVIFAAVVIILGLGAMFTYAYLRSQNIPLF